MILKKLLAISFPLFSFSAFGADDLREWIGFKHPSEPGMPAPIARAAESVFQIFYPHGEPEIFDIAKVDVQSLPEKTLPEAFRKLQFLACQKQGVKNCPVMPTSYSATCFFMRDAQTLVTNLHVLHDWLYEVKRNNSGIRVEDLQSPIFILNAKWDLIFAPFRDPDVTLKLSDYNTAQFVFSEKYPDLADDKVAREMKLKFQTSDYVELHFSRSAKSVVPLIPAKEILKFDQFYLVGFPNPTHIYAKRGGKDAADDGMGAWVSSGTFFDSSQDGLRITTSNPSGPGVSGGPLLNRQGEVVGVVYANLQDSESTTSYFLRINDELRHKIWREN